MIVKYIFITTLFLLCSLTLHAQNTQGTDFWVTFGKNASVTTTTNIDLQIRIVGGAQEATVTINFTALNFATTFIVAAGQVYTYDFNEDATLKDAVYNTQSEEKSNRSINITSNKPITVYALNQIENSTDASNILPLTALGVDYYVISYNPISNYKDAYAIIATQNNTHVYHNSVLLETLNTGEVYYYTSIVDMTGTRITTDKPVALFAMTQLPYIPIDRGSADHLFQQLAPISTWGKTFFVPVSHMGKDRVRIIVSQNDTEIVLRGGTIITQPNDIVLSDEGDGKITISNINAGEWVELETSLENIGCYIQADKPVGVCTYFTGCTYNNSSDLESDPSQAWLPSIEQVLKSAIIAPFIPSGTTALNQHYALIITPTATKDNTMVSIGGANATILSGGTWYDNVDAGMSFYFLPLTNNSTISYTITNQEGLIIMGYGIGYAESYYYLASSAMRTLDAAFYVNDIHYQDLSSEVICTQPIEFRAEINGDMSTATGHLKWYIDDVEEIAAQDQFTWGKSLVNGKYEIKMVILMDDNITTKTVKGTLTVTSCGYEEPDTCTPHTRLAQVCDLCLD